jgi:transposase
VKSLSAHAVRSLIIARKKLVGQRVTLENQIRGLAVVFGVRLPRALTAAFIDQALKASDGVVGLSAAMRGLIAARTAVMTAVAAIDADMRRMTRASEVCRRLMTIPGVGQLTALAFVSAIDDPTRIRRSRDVGAYLGLVPKRYQSGEVDYVGGISKCGDRRVRTLLYEAANVMLTRYKGQLKLKDWAFAIARRSTMRKARIALARRLAIIHARHAAGRNGGSRRVGLPITETGDRIELPQGATPEGGSRRRRRFCRTGPTTGRLRFQPRRPAPSLPHQAPASAQRTQASQGVDIRKSLAP